jgi:hypothetical protein
VARAVKLDGFVGDLDLPPARPLDLREELHERGLARPVLPCHDMDLARHYLQVHAIDRENAGELFGDVPELYDRGSSLGWLRLR